MEWWKHVLVDVGKSLVQSAKSELDKLVPDETTKVEPRKIKVDRILRCARCKCEIGATYYRGQSPSSYNYCNDCGCNIMGAILMENKL